VNLLEDPFATPQVSKGEALIAFVAQSLRNSALSLGGMLERQLASPNGGCRFAEINRSTATIAASRVNLSAQQQETSHCGVVSQRSG
jgi:hypothetical protein